MRGGGWGVGRTECVCVGFARVCTVAEVHHRLGRRQRETGRQARKTRAPVAPAAQWSSRRSALGLAGLAKGPHPTFVGGGGGVGFPRDGMNRPATRAGLREQQSALRFFLFYI